MTTWVTTCFYIR